MASEDTPIRRPRSTKAAGTRTTRAKTAAAAEAPAASAPTPLAAEAATSSSDSVAPKRAPARKTARTAAAKRAPAVVPEAPVEREPAPTRVHVATASVEHAASRGASTVEHATSRGASTVEHATPRGAAAVERATARDAAASPEPARSAPAPERFVAEHRERHAPQAHEESAGGAGSPPSGGANPIRTPSASGGAPGPENPNDWRSPERRRGHGRRGGRRRRRNRNGQPFPDENGPAPGGQGQGGQTGQGHGGQGHGGQGQSGSRRGPAPSGAPGDERSSTMPGQGDFGFGGDSAVEVEFDDGLEGELEEAGGPRGDRNAPAPVGPNGPRHDPQSRQPQQRGRQPDVARGPRGERPFRERPPRPDAPPAEPMPAEVSGILYVEHGGFGTLRQQDTNWLPAKTDVFVPLRLIQQLKLREGSLVAGRVTRGQKHKYALVDVTTVDGKNPQEVKNVPAFKSLTTVDPDFHYATGDITDEVSMRIVDLLCPIGRGQRGLIVAPPRTGKTTLLKQFAKGIEVGYPDVHLFVLLVDERPEEATDWQRSTKGHVFSSTSDEPAKTHIALAEAVWARCMRLVECGQDVVLLLDSLTRLSRAYNNMAAGSGRTMSGGLDSRAMERPRQIFGSARNTEKAGSLTILGTALIDTGSRMDQLIFEEFKGTGNMELVLSRRLADRRIFPAIDIEKSGTRKEEKILSSKKLKSVHILRRVLQRMNPYESMELLITKLSEVEQTDEFLKRFEVDPEA